MWEKKMIFIFGILVLISLVTMGYVGFSLRENAVIGLELLVSKEASEVFKEISDTSDRTFRHWQI